MNNLIIVHTGNNIPQAFDFFEIENGATLHPYEIAKKVDNIDFEKGLTINTNSDHVINRLLVNQKELGFEINIFHYMGDKIDVIIPKNGKIHKPPVGFFDQIGKDLRILI